MHFTDVRLAEDVCEASLQIAPQSVDGDDRQRTAAIQGVVSVEQQLVDGVVAGLGGQV